jgi:ribulose-5-phosphate 4-epimerase/fuculose-1-phosphate aldolase
MAFEETKRQVAVGNRVLHHIGLTDGITLALGHVSMRVPGEPDRFIVKGRGYAVDVLPVVRGEDMIVCDLDGAMVEGPPGGMPCFEVKIHSAIYKNHPEVNSVVHVHPRYTVLMSVLGVPLVPMCQEGANLVRTPVPMWSHTRLVVTDEDGEGLAHLIGDSPVAMLPGHGAVATGTSISRSIANVYALEEQARMNYLAVAASGPDHPRISEALLVEVDATPTVRDLPHFASSLPPESGAVPDPGAGPYLYCSSLVEAGA